MRKSKDSSFYRDLLSCKELRRYYGGHWAERNDILIEQLSPYLPAESHVLDLAAGSSYIAERIIKNERVKSYTWNDFNPKLQTLVSTRISDPKFEINAFDADDTSEDLSRYNVFICVSLEHIEKDREILSKLSTGCVVSICSPNVPDPSHVRIFQEMSEFISRYEDLISFEAKQAHETGQYRRFVATGFRK